MGKIPEFPEFIPVDEQNIRQIIKAIQKFPPEVSDLSCGNIWGYRKTLNYHVSILNDCTLIFSKTEEHSFFLPPLGKDRLIETMKRCLEKGIFSSVPENLAKEAAGSGLKIEEKRDDADYIYYVEDLAEMRGNRYQSKRNFANYFEKNYKYSFEDLTLPCVKECLELQETWCNMKKCIIFKSLEAENRAIQQMFANFELLGLFGVVIRIDGKIQAFSIAEKLDEDTVVVHVQKANTEFRGIYPALNRLFCSKTIKGIKYVNWEQDLGNPGLKKAKLSYHPARLLMKYDLHY